MSGRLVQRKLRDLARDRGLVDPNANLTLSQQRADSVMAELVKLGVDAIRMEAEGYGQEHPVADNSTEEGRAKNRRIDLRVTSK